MTDKQIIDRVNVKECKYYCNGKCERYEEFVEADYANYSIKCICEKENDLGTYDICDYKQLKRKEQECEKWKNAYEVKEDALAETEEYCEELEEQRNQLKKELEQEKAWHKTSDEISKVNSSYTMKLKQTLAEIKEIAEQGVKIHDDIVVSKQIIQKIEELKVQ